MKDSVYEQLSAYRHYDSSPMDTLRDKHAQDLCKDQAPWKKCKFLR